MPSKTVYYYSREAAYEFAAEIKGKGGLAKVKYLSGPDKYEIVYLIDRYGIFGA